MLIVTPNLAIDERELHETFVQAAGPGGQNVNKVATAVQLRFDVRNSPSLPSAVRERLLSLAANRITNEGVLIIEARRFRSQEQNRHDARQRLLALLRQAAKLPTARRATRPSKAAQQRRVAEKRHHSRMKQLRRSGSGDND